MTVTFLGTGTSHGVPVIGCDCCVCTSDDPRNRRFRSSVLIRDEEHSLLIDTGPEFRLQALRAGIKRLDAVLFTHAHADHISGLDDIRPLCGNGPMPVYGNGRTLREIVERFSYIFHTTQRGGGKPKVDLREVSGKPFRVSVFEVIPVPIIHGNLGILGYRIGTFAYLTDCNSIPEESYRLLEGLDVLVLDALRYRPHETHFSVDDALGEVRKIGPVRAYFTHMTHDIDHETLLRRLPQGVEPAFDGLTVNVMKVRR